jgi:hypothetical protein
MAILYRQRRCVFAAAFVLAACGGKNQNNFDASNSLDAPADALGVDALPVPSNIKLYNGAAALTGWQFTDTRFEPRLLKPHSTKWLAIRNEGPSSPVTIELVGSSFTVNGDCGVPTAGSPPTLRSGEICKLRLQFEPSGVGVQAGILRVKTATQVVEFPLTGVGLAQTFQWSFLDSNIDFTDVFADNVAKGYDITLSNNSAAPIIYSSSAVTGTGFAITASTCTTVQPGGNCTVTVKAQATAAGALAGTLRVLSNTTPLTIDLTALVLRKIHVTVVGTSQANIVSAPAGMNCNGDCEGEFLAGDVTLTSMTSLAMLSSWSAPCSTDPTCTLVDGPSVTLTAMFTPVTKRVSIVFGGGNPGVGHVIARTDSRGRQDCDANCDVIVNAGERLIIEGYSASKFNGWTGGCVSADRECTIASVTDNLTVTGQFDRDDHEISAFHLPIDLSVPLFTAVLKIAFASNGDLFIAGKGVLSRYTQLGALVWTANVAEGNPSDVVTDSIGNVYVLFGGTMYKYTSAGAFLSSRSDSFAVARYPNDDFAIQTSTGISRVNSAGVVQWSVAVAPRALTVTSDSLLVVAVVNQTAINRYSATGQPLSDLGTVNEETIVLSSDKLGGVAANGSSRRFAHLKKWNSLGVVTADDVKSLAIPTDFSLPVFVGSDSTGGAIYALPLSDYLYTGYYLWSVTAAGAINFTIDKPFVSILSVDSGHNISDLASDQNGHIAVAGTYWYNQPWVAVFSE